MPGISDSRFEKLVIYVCAHSSDGAMGLIINKPSDAISFPNLLEQLSVSNCSGTNRIGIQCGGPVEVSRGFVLHSPDYMREATLFVDDAMALTANLDILRASANDTGPRRFVGTWLCRMGTGPIRYRNSQ
jgi:putative transcriptional regulator